MIQSTNPQRLLKQAEDALTKIAKLEREIKDHERRIADLEKMARNANLQKY